MKIKVCGMRDPDNLRELSALPVDYVGFIFYEKSKRYAERAELSDWLQANPALFAQVARTGVFVNAEVDYLLNIVHDYQLDFVQLHGNESPGYCQELQLLWSVRTIKTPRLIKAFSVNADFDFGLTEAYASSCELFIFDTGGQAAHGGTGVKWDWQKLAAYHGETPFLLSGGIGPEDVARVQAVAHPQLLGLDLNSRFESAPGVKDIAKLRAFLTAVQANPPV